MNSNIILNGPVHEAMDTQPGIFFLTTKFFVQFSILLFLNINFTYQNMTLTECKHKHTTGVTWYNQKSNGIAREIEK